MAERWAHNPEMMVQLHLTQPRARYSVAEEEAVNLPGQKPTVGSIPASCTKAGKYFLVVLLLAVKDNLEILSTEPVNGSVPFSGSLMVKQATVNGKSLVRAQPREPK